MTQRQLSLKNFHRQKNALMLEPYQRKQWPHMGYTSSRIQAQPTQQGTKDPTESGHPIPEGGKDCVYEASHLFWPFKLQDQVELNNPIG